MRSPGSPSQRKGFLRRLWPYYGDDPEEAVNELERLLREKAEEAVKRSETSQAIELVDESKRIRHVNRVPDGYYAFLKYQFTWHLRNYRAFAGKYAFAFTLLSISAIASSLLSSGIAAGWSNAHWARWTILILGLVAGTSAATNQLWRPGQKASSRMRGANALTSEAWAYVTTRGAYHGKTEQEALDVFVDQVARIVQITAAVDEALPGPADAGAGPPQTA